MSTGLTDQSGKPPVFDAQPGNPEPLVPTLSVGTFLVPLRGVLNNCTKDDDTPRGSTPRDHGS